MKKLHYKLRMDWNYHSNRMEGNTLTESETRTFLLTGITAKGKPFRDYLEMKGHSDAVNKLYGIVNDDLQITERLIKEFHRLILVEEFRDDRAEIRPGAYKTLPNYLYAFNGERVDFTAPEDAPARVNSLVNWLGNHLTPPERKRKRYDLHPLLIACGFHVQFINIHPFGAGNGRMARILTNLILMRCGYVPLIAKAEDRDRYFEALHLRSDDNPEPLDLLRHRHAGEFGPFCTSTSRAKWKRSRGYVPTLLAR